MPTHSPAPCRCDVVTVDERIGGADAFENDPKVRRSTTKVPDPRRAPRQLPRDIGSRFAMANNASSRRFDTPTF